MLASIENHGTICLFRPEDMEAEEWVDENLSDDRQSFGVAIAIEPRYLPDIVRAFLDAGGKIGE